MAVIYRNPQYTYSDLRQWETNRLKELKKDLADTQRVRGDYVWIARTLYFIDSILSKRAS